MEAFHRSRWSRVGRTVAPLPLLVSATLTLAILLLLPGAIGQTGIARADGGGTSGSALACNPISTGSGKVGPNGEAASACFALEPGAGGLYTDHFLPAEWHLELKVTQPPPVPPQESKEILPLKQVRVNLGRDVTFNPDPKMPVCGAPDIGPPPINMSVPPQEMIKRCPDSVIGNGTADLYLGHRNLAGSPGPTLSREKGTAVVLVAFNGGRDKAGDPVIRIYGYSKPTAGIYIETALQKDGALDIAVPPFSADSAVGRLDLNLPGSAPVPFDGLPVPESVGRDPEYLRTRCSTGRWELTARFTLGTRDADGTPTSPDTVLDAPRFGGDCAGLPGVPEYRVDVRTTGEGSGRVSAVPAGPVYPAGTAVTLTATPDEGSLFSGWRGCDTEEGPVCSIRVTRDRKVEAEFTTVPSPEKAPRITEAPDLSTRAREATFRFTPGAGETRPVTGYLCRVDGAPFAPCLSPATYAGLLPGEHRFEVRAVNPGGEGPVAGHTWTVVEEYSPGPGPPKSPQPAPRPVGRAALAPLKVRPAARRVRRGGRTFFRVTVRSTGRVPAAAVRVCARSPSRAVVTGRCAALGRIVPGRAGTARIRIRVRGNARRGNRARVTFTATARGASSRRAAATVRVG